MGAIPVLSRRVDVTDRKSSRKGWVLKVKEHIASILQRKVKGDSKSAKERDPEVAHGDGKECWSLIVLVFHLCIILVHQFQRQVMAFAEPREHNKAASLSSHGQNQVTIIEVLECVLLRAVQLRRCRVFWCSVEASGMEPALLADRRSSQNIMTRLWITASVEICRCACDFAGAELILARADVTDCQDSTARGLWLRTAIFIFVPAHGLHRVPLYPKTSNMMYRWSSTNSCSRYENLQKPG